MMTVSTRNFASWCTGGEETLPTWPYYLIWLYRSLCLWIHWWYCYVLGHQWSLPYKIKILSLQKILINIFLVSKEVTLWLQKALVLFVRLFGLEGNKILTNSPSDLFKSHDDRPTSHVWLEGYDLQGSTDSRNYGTTPYGLLGGSVFLRFGFWATLDFHVMSLMAADFVMIKKSIYLSDLILSPLHVILLLPLKPCTYVLTNKWFTIQKQKKKLISIWLPNTAILPYWTLNYSTDVNHTNQITLTQKIRPQTKLTRPRMEISAWMVQGYKCDRSLWFRLVSESLG